MKLLPFIFLLLMFSCVSGPDTNTKEEVESISEIQYTEYSQTENQYLNFNSTKAVNKIADIENEYFGDVIESSSRFYGTVWREGAENFIVNDSISQFDDYLINLSPKYEKADSLHCTLYAYEGLKAGLTDAQLIKLEKLHRARWKSREIAGWSIGYLLVKHFDWKAYLAISPNSTEYQHCLKAYKKNKSYPVWKQPNIPLEDLLIIGQEDSSIYELLMENEFSWGFSEQGIHTWISRFEVLKECNWLGAPSVKYKMNDYEKPLFIKTDFLDYKDYNSHVIVVPPKVKK